MDFGPGLDESLLGAWQIAANALDRIEREHALGILIRRMKVRPVVRGADFHEHANDDSEEPRELRHQTNLASSARMGSVGLTLGFSRGGTLSPAAVGCKPMLASW